MREIKIKVEPIKHNDGTKSYGIATYRDGKRVMWVRVERHLLLSATFRKAYLQRQLWSEKMTHV